MAVETSLPDPTATALDPQVAAQLAAVEAPKVRQKPGPKPGSGRRKARSAKLRAGKIDEMDVLAPSQDRWAAAKAARDDVEVIGGDGPIITAAPALLSTSTEGLSQKEKLDVLWDWFTLTGSKLRLPEDQRPFKETETVRCLEGEQVFEAPSYPFRVRDGVVGPCPNPVHGTR